MNLTEEIENLCRLYGLTIKDIRQMIKEQIDNLSGLIDDDSAVVIVEKALRCNNLLFIDLDENIEDAIEHLKTHNTAYIRNSCGGNKHVIISDYCDYCKTLNDNKFKGMVLFDNKGNLWAEHEWHNLKDKTKLTMKSQTIIHFIIEPIGSNKELIHFYATNIKDVINNLDKIYEIKPTKIYYTFHLGIIKYEESCWFEMRQSKNKKTMEEFKVQYKMNTFFNIERLYKVYTDFIKYIPQGFNYEKLRM